MASFLDKLKKGMDIKNIANVEENIQEIEKPEESPLVPLEPEEIKPEELEQKLKENRPEGPIAENASIKNFILGNLEKESSFAKASEDKEKKEKIKKPKKQKESKKNIEVKELVSNESASAKAIADKAKKWFETEGQLVVDVYETDGDIVIQSAIAGVEPEEIDISIENDMVSIKGKREQKIEEKGKNYFYSECHWGYFSREIILPKEVDAGHAQAGMKNGILTIRMPKVEKEKKKISIK